MGDMLDGRTGEIDQIGRHQGQDARRQEADQAGNQRRRDRYVVDHAVIANIALPSLAGPTSGRPDRWLHLTDARDCAITAAMAGNFLDQ